MRSDTPKKAAGAEQEGLLTREGVEVGEEKKWKKSEAKRQIEKRQMMV